AGEDPAAEGDHLPARVGDGEHDTLAEAVEEPAPPVRTIAAEHETRRDRVVDPKPLRTKMACEGVAGARRPAEAEAGDRLVVEAALAEVGAGAGTARGRELGT